VYDSDNDSITSTPTESVHVQTSVTYVLTVFFSSFCMAVMERCMLGTMHWNHPHYDNWVGINVAYVTIALCVCQ
jgi:hypothetical protein